MDYWLLISGGIISLAGMFFHGVAGQKVYMSNIDKSDMESITKSLSLVSWHIFTIFLFVGAVTLFYIAYNPDFAIAAYPVIGVNLFGAILFVSLGIGNHGGLLKLPGAYLMGSTALLAWLGI
jgi:uncharacterized membrane protein